MGGGGGGARILLLAVCAELRTEAAATDSIRLWWLLVSSPPGPPPTVCVLDESSSSSSDETSELASELDGVGEGGESVSCSCSIVRNSWMDSFRAHSWDSNDRSSCRRPYISLRKMASWVSSVVGFRTAPD